MTRSDAWHICIGHGHSPLMTPPHAYPSFPDPTRHAVKTHIDTRPRRCSALDTASRRRGSGCTQVLRLFGRALHGTASIGSSCDALREIFREVSEPLSSLGLSLGGSEDWADRLYIEDKKERARARVRAAPRIHPHAWSDGAS